MNSTSSRPWLALGLAFLAMASFASATERNRGGLSELDPGPQSWQLHRSALARGKQLATNAGLSVVVDQCVRDDMAARDTPGASVAVAVDGVLVYENGYGEKRHNGNDPVHADTRFRIGSITKQMTAVAVLQQLQAGAVWLDEPVTRTIPELVLPGPWTADTIRIHHLLSHTTGFPDLPLQADGPTDDQALSRWAADHGAFGLHAPPGSFFNYSNPNYMLAGLVVERATGMEYHEYIKTRVFEPAGLTATTFDPAEVLASGDYSFGHLSRNTGGYSIFAPNSYDNWIGAPAGWAFSTAPDLVRWALLLMDGGGEVLDPDLVQLMQEPVADSYFSPFAGYGYGLFIEDVTGIRLVYHGGNISGWGAFLLWAPEHRFAVAVLANSQQSLMDAAGCIAGAVLPFASDPAPDITTDPETWYRYAGTYALTNNLGQTSEAVVHLDDGTLSMTITQQGEGSHTTPVYQLFFDTFVIDLDGDGLLDSDCTFVRGHGDHAPVKWLRNRRIVGRRAPDARAGGGRVSR